MLLSCGLLFSSVGILVHNIEMTHFLGIDSHHKIEIATPETSFSRRGRNHICAEKLEVRKATGDLRKNAVHYSCRALIPKKRENFISWKYYLCLLLNFQNLAPLNLSRILWSVCCEVGLNQLHGFTSNPLSLFGAQVRWGPMMETSETNFSKSPTF